jgi:hypothetical protein
MAFSSTNLKLSTVLSAYGITTGKMRDLIGRRVYTVGDGVGTVITSPFSLLGTFGGKFAFPTTAQGPVPFTQGMAVPNGVVSFVLELIGGGGGGGGAAGDRYDVFGVFQGAGQQGGGGGGAGYCITPKLLYNPANYAAMSVSNPTSGGFGPYGGFSGQFPRNGVDGTPGGDAAITYNGQTFRATRGSNGGGGIGQGGTAFAGSGGINVGGSGGAGQNGSGRNGGLDGSLGLNGRNGTLGQGGLGGQGGQGTGGGSGGIFVTWYFT